MSVLFLMKHIVTVCVFSICLSFLAYSWAFDAPTVTIKVGYGAGGGYDMAARLVSRHIGRFLPGSPKVIVQNVPGSGSMRLTQLLLGSEPADGSVIGAIGASIAFASKLDPSYANYNPLELGWIGSLAAGENMCIVSRTTGIGTIEEFKNEEFQIGASGRTSSTYVLAALARNALGARFNIVTGFDGVADIDLAMQRGEIAGHCVASKGDLEVNNLHERVNVIVRFGSEQIEGYESVARLSDLITDPLKKKAAAFVEASVELDNPFVLPAGSSKETVEVFRAAFTSMVRDPEFIDDAGRIRDLVLRPMSGAELENVIQDKLASDPAVFEAARTLLK